MSLILGVEYAMQVKPPTPSFSTVITPSLLNPVGNYSVKYWEPVDYSLREILSKAIDEVLEREKATWLLCDGSTCRRDKYPELAKTINPSTLSNHFILPSVNMTAYIKAKPDNTIHPLGTIAIASAGIWNSNDKRYLTADELENRIRNK